MRLLIIAAIISMSVPAFSATTELRQGAVIQQDGNGNQVAPIQEFTPNGKFDVLLTVVKSSAYDMRTFVKWSFYGTTACLFRNQSTATRVGTWRTMPASTFVIRGVHPATPYLNFSGCVAGEVQRQ